MWFYIIYISIGLVCGLISYLFDKEDSPEERRVAILFSIFGWPVIAIAITVAVVIALLIRILEEIRDMLNRIKTA